jgi:tRNA (guanine37-N1)-methyltransferase
MVGDSRRLIEKHLVSKADRIIMNLPHNAQEYLDAAILALRPSGGIIHFYGIKGDEENAEVTFQNEIMEKIVALGREVTSVNRRIIRPAAPHWNQVVFDFKIAGRDN